MQGKISPEELEQKYPNGIPKEYDPVLLPDLTRHQVVFSDETHFDQEGGPAYRSKYQIRFPRDSSGRYSPPSVTNPTPIYPPIEEKTSFKYAQQVCFCLGCATIKLPGGRVIGRRSYIFDYIGQRLVSIVVCARRVREELNRVKSLKVEGRRSK